MNQPTETLESKYLSTSDLEERFKRNIKSVKGWIKTRNFPPAVICGTGVENLWLRTQVEEWEMAQVAAVGWSLERKATAG